MIPQTKKFETTDYNECNSPGVVIVGTLFESQGFVVNQFVEQKEKKDFFVQYGSKSYKVEAERRTRNAGKPISTYLYDNKLHFPYTTLHVVQRKQGDEWDYYSQVMDCYDFMRNEQTFVVATVYKTVLNGIELKPTDCYRNGVQITQGELMGNVPISQVSWAVSIGSTWKPFPATTKNMSMMNAKFASQGLTWVDLLAD